jgi:hypothetical protein
MTSGMTPALLPVLVLFPSESDPARVKEGLDSVQAAFAARGSQVAVTDSAAWYRERFDTCGSWESWALEAATGKSYRSRQPYFVGFVVIGQERDQRGFQEIVSLALDVRKPVYRLLDAGLEEIKRPTRK